MKIIDRYIIRGFIAPFLYCLFMFLFLYIIIDLFGHLDEIIKQGIPFSVVKTYYLSSLPLIFVQATPFAVLLATVFLLGNLNRHNEIVALMASGISTFRIIAPLLLLAIFISAAVYFVNDRLVPESLITSYTIKETKLEKGQKEKTDRLENITVFGKDGKLFYARYYEIQNKILRDVILLEHDANQVLRRKITAEKMEWLGSKWRFYDCGIYRFDKDGAILGEPLVFKTKILRFYQKPEDLLKHQTQPEFMNYSQLKDYIHVLSLGSERTAKKLLVDLHQKLALPFMSIVIMLIGIPFALKRRRSGAIMSMGISIGIAIGFYGVNAISIALGKGGFLPPIVSVWAANIIFGGLGIILIRKIRA